MNLYKTLLLVVFLVVVAVQPSEGAGIVGVSPATLEYRNVLRGGYSERPFIVTFDLEEQATIIVDTQGNISTWINLSSKDFTVSRNKPAVVTASILPPLDVANGNYSGVIRIKAEQQNQASREGHATGIIVAMLEVFVTVEIIDQEVIICSAKEYSIGSVEQKDDLIFKTSLFNAGNVRISPEVKIKIWDQTQEKVIKEDIFFATQILPSKNFIVERRISTSDFPLGQYWADVSVTECDGTDLLTFDILEPGTLKADGILSNLYSARQATVGDTVPVVSIFKNIGQKDVSAKFKGELDFQGKIIQLLESENTLVEKGTTENWTLYFTPQKVGTYVARGRVFYDNKRTYESSTTIIVVPRGGNTKKLLLYGAYGIMFLFILFLFYKIRQERRKLWNRIHS